MFIRFKELIIDNLSNLYDKLIFIRIKMIIKAIASLPYQTYVDLEKDGDYVKTLTFKINIES